MDRISIENEARSLQYEIWHKRALIFPLGAPSTSAMFEPSIAARVLGMEYEHREQLGSFIQNGERFEVAGMVDRTRGIIAVSNRFPHPVRRFTGAHELGHVMMHPQMLMHRDRPALQTTCRARPIEEQQADYFAACFLAPRRLVEDEFKARFLRVPLRLDDDVAWNLMGEAAYELYSPSSESLDFAGAVAGSRSFNGRHFVSLADHFGMSVSAMAIRLHELQMLTD